MKSSGLHDAVHAGLSAGLLAPENVSSFMANGTHMINGTHMANVTLSNVVANGTHDLVASLAPDHPLQHITLLLAVGASLFLYLSPLRVALQTVRQGMGLKEVGGWIIPTYFIFGQSYLWSCYGYSAGLTDLGRCNGLGAGLCMASIGLVAMHAYPRALVQPLLGLSIFVLVAFSVGVHISCSSVLQKTQVFALAATIFNILMFVAPLPQVMAIVRDGTFERFPWTITIASFFSSLLWAQYSTLVNDRLYLVTNILGMLVCGVELLVVAWAIQNQSSKYRLGGDSQPLMPRLRSRTTMSTCYGNARAFQGHYDMQLEENDPLRAVRDQAPLVAGFASEVLACSVRKLPNFSGSWRAANTGAHEPPKDMTLLSCMDPQTKSLFGAQEVLHSQEHEESPTVEAWSPNFSAASYAKMIGAFQTPGESGVGNSGDIVCIL